MRGGRVRWRGPDSDVIHDEDGLPRIVGLTAGAGYIAAPGIVADEIEGDEDA